MGQVKRTDELRGVAVIVAGAGLAGLAAARDLDRRGADVSVVEARERPGGRVWTIRDGLTSGQHAEAGGDFIESSQESVLALAREVGLTPVPIIRRGFAFYGLNPRGKLEIQSFDRAMRTLTRPFDRLVRDYTLAEHRWDSAIAQRLARQTIASWLTAHRAPSWVLERFRGLRGLFLADPEDLSVIALVDFFADGAFDSSEMTRIKEGNDRIATEVAKRLRSRPRYGAVLRRVRQEGDRAVASIEEDSRTRELTADYLVIAVPASVARDIQFEPALPDSQRAAIDHLRYGPATRLLLQFDRRFWHKRGRPNAFGSAQSIGAVWDGNEQQKDRPGILSFLAGGRASAELQSILETEGAPGVVKRIGWLGRPSTLLASRAIVWDDDPWARGGYAYFDPGFDPLWRDWLARPAGRIVFAGEHTSIRWQGYMNGAVESGLRAAAEIRAMARPI